MAEFMDCATFLLLTGASLSVGAYFSFHTKVPVSRTTDEVFLGSKSLQMLPLAMSVLATVGSGTGVIGLPAHMYAYGWHIGWLSVSNILLIPVAVIVVVPVLYQLHITSVFQNQDQIPLQGSLQIQAPRQSSPVQVLLEVLLQGLPTRVTPDLGHPS
ncbi:hypothetical protein HPB49_008607 [Dermacentor silvarum]|uniref:Uncharacterized protein n=1 Tax=Dermacentor silvarum TaxID=543639 RepID=A0ACB8DY25_DERSI|nr:hypothetical protein HPB49_008607 [Dermacentor silvarum]